MQKTTNVKDLTQEEYDEIIEHVKTLQAVVGALTEEILTIRAQRLTRPNKDLMY